MNIFHKTLQGYGNVEVKATVGPYAICSTDCPGIRLIDTRRASPAGLSGGFYDNHYGMMETAAEAAVHCVLKCLETEKIVAEGGKPTPPLPLAACIARRDGALARKEGKPRTDAECYSEYGMERFYWKQGWDELNELIDARISWYFQQT